MKKSLLVVSCLGLSALALASCSDKKANTITREEFKDMYTTSAVGGINMLSMNAGTARRAKLSDEEKNQVLENIKFVDDFLNSNSSETAEKDLVEGDKYFGEFSKTYDLNVTKLDGSMDVYRFYYSETVTEQDKEEVESELNGVVVLNEGKEDEKKFKVSGSKEVENTEEEKGFEITFNIIDEANPTNHVTIEQENEQEGNEKEIEYKYSRFDGTTLVESIKLEIENENNETEYVVSKLTGEDKTKYSYEVKEKDGKKYIEVELIENNNRTVAKLEATADGYVVVE